MVDTLELDWQVRHYVYNFFVQQARPPSVEETAERFIISVAGARASYLRLQERHAFMLIPDTFQIQMANPLSARPTPYYVETQGRKLYANCAWDMLGIPAMLHAETATIQTMYTHSAQRVTITVEHDRVQGVGIIHFLVPFKHWYDDLLHT